MNLSLITAVLCLSFLASVSGMGFTNIFAHVHEKSDEEVSLLKQLMEDTHFTAKRLTIFPRRQNKNSRHRTPAKQRRSQHKYMPTMDVTQSFSSHDEEILERLIELQN
mmetsp:Transcript_5331/g.11008  ORF Transcript_5331/g.11008 Transcript_5331/m.11008 type:complete len:108 (-) Transcript_5331:379-702(-)